MVGVPEWGVPVWVHDDKGSKLDGRGILWGWVGYDINGTDGHGVYWAQKGRVSVERNIRLTLPTVTVRVA